MMSAGYWFLCVFGRVSLCVCLLACFSGCLFASAFVVLSLSVGWFVRMYRRLLGILVLPLCLYRCLHVRVLWMFACLFARV